MIIPDQTGIVDAGGNVVSDSLVRIELITHFHRNPGLDATSSDLAEAIGRDSTQVECQIKKLVQLHILEEKPHNGLCHYRYVPPHSVAAYLIRKTGK
jgi:predicted transcriptional regulator